MKAQLFSLDALLALLFVTIAILLVSIQFEHYYQSANDLQSEEIQLLASDYSQIAVKRILAVSEPNVVSEAKMNDLKTFLDNNLPADYSYEASLLSTSINRSSCNSKNFISIENRSVVDSNTLTQAWFVLKVCS